MALECCQPDPRQRLQAGSRASALRRARRRRSRAPMISMRFSSHPLPFSRDEDDSRHDARMTGRQTVIFAGTKLFMSACSGPPVNSRKPPKADFLGVAAGYGARAGFARAGMTVSERRIGNAGAAGLG